mmetsp:Transcript_31074/g.52494  ORF Transcript_31074/g.52494 Transcript_31074/m.52494 type:complete len:326 (+) Transcript_31074:38-1015(+)
MLKGFSAKGQPTLGPLFGSTLSQLRLCDIGCNILDEMFHGEYNNKQRHDPDINLVIERAHSMGVKTMIFTGSNVEESRKSLSFCETHPLDGLYSTVGVHPCCAKEFTDRNPDLVIEEIREIIDTGISGGKIVAFGEFGLDYDRFQYCDKDTQLLGFRKQLDLAVNYDLPLFLHNRNTSGDFEHILSEYHGRIKGGGVVHSFTGDAAEMQTLIDLGFYIGVNGCSLRTEEGLANVANIPDHLLLLETDAPWCGIKRTHPSFPYVSTSFPVIKKEKFEEGVMVKDRNEPCTMVQVLEVVAKIRDVDPFALAEQVYLNSETLFPLIKR